MPYSVVEIIRRWCSERTDEVLQQPTEDLLTWASVFGTDLERAWSECARGDFAVALAAACDAPLQPIAVAALDAAEEAQGLVSKRLKLGRQSLEFARRTLSGEVPVTELAKEIAPVNKRLYAMIARRRRELADLVAAYKKLFKRACIDLSKRMSAAIAKPGLPKSAEPGTPEHQAWSDGILVRCSEALARFSCTKLAASYRAADRAAAHAAAELLTLESAASASAAAMSSAIELALLETIERVVKLGSHGAERYAEGLERLNDARENGYSTASRAFSNAADAFRAAAAKGSKARAASAAEIGSVAFHTALGQRLSADDIAGIRARAKKHVDQVADEHRRAHAFAIRARVPFSSLRRPLDDQEEQELIQRDGREALRTRIAQLTTPLRIWGDAPALEALEVVLAILEAPGPLDRRALAPALRTMHERTADLFAAHAAQTEDEEIREDARAASESAREAVREMDEIIAEGEREPPN